MKAVYARFFDVQSIDVANFKAAETWLKEQEEAGDIYSIGIYDDDTNILYVPDNRADAFGGDKLFNRQVASCSEKGIEVLKIEFYAANVGKNQYSGICAPIER